MEQLKCASLQETLMYLRLKANEHMEGISLINYPTISSFYDNKNFLIKSGTFFSKKLPYKFDTGEYIKGNLTFKNITAPWYISEKVVSTKKDVYELDEKGGDILWKICVFGKGIKKINLFVGHMMIQEIEGGEGGDGEPIEIFDGKGFPLIALNSSFYSVSVRVDHDSDLGGNGNGDKITIQQYLVSLNESDKKELTYISFMRWPEGSFSNGIFQEKLTSSNQRVENGQPVKCMNMEESLMYLVYLRDQSGGSIAKYPTLSKMFERDYLPCDFDQPTLRSKLRYFFDAEEYIRGNILLKDVSAPYFVMDEHSAVESEVYQDLFQITNCGDILWKLCVYGDDLARIKVYIGRPFPHYGELVEQFDCTAKSTVTPGEYTINLMGGKGIPLINIASTSVFVQCDRTVKKSKSTPTLTIHAYIINLDTLERRTLQNKKVLEWPEGTLNRDGFKGRTPC